ncbi:protein of unknown function (plasmid) [Cupriavidus taiwanensis]|nr:protein of unknown function [Cupriavidus taiwanensis]
MPQVWRKPRDTYWDVSVMLALQGEVAAAASAGGTVAVTCGTGATASVVSPSACASAGSAWHSSRGKAPDRAQDSAGLAAKVLRNMVVSPPCSRSGFVCWVAGFGGGGGAARPTGRTLPAGTLVPAAQVPQSGFGPKARAPRRWGQAGIGSGMRAAGGCPRSATVCVRAGVAL